MNDLWTLDAQATWFSPAPTGSPPSVRSDHTAVMDSVGRMWIFGGDNLGSGGLRLCSVLSFNRRADIRYAAALRQAW